MAITKPSRSMLSTGISDSSDATFLTADSSENATFAGNLTVSGNLTVTGTTTQVDTVTMNAQNAVLFEGATADAHETTLTTVDPTGDRTISLPNVSGTLPVLAAASVTQITSTPEELNLLDGSSANTVVNSKAVIYGSSGEVKATSLTATDGILELDDDGSHNGVINSPASLRINIDSDDSSTGETFIVGQNQTAVNTSNELFKLHDSGFAEFTGASDLRITLGSTGTAGQNTANWIRAEGSNIALNAASDSVKFEIGGTEAMRIKAASPTGKVGIGSNDPDTQLHVKNTGGIELRLEADSNNNGQEDCFIRFYTDGKFQEGVVGMDNNNNTTLFSGNTENAMVLGCVSNLPVVLATNNTERAQVTAAGQFLVGIGSSTSPELGGSNGVGEFVGSSSGRLNALRLSNSYTVSTGTASTAIVFGGHTNGSRDNAAIEVQNTANGGDAMELQFHVRDNANALQKRHVIRYDGSMHTQPDSANVQHYYGSTGGEFGGNSSHNVRAATNLFMFNAGGGSGQFVFEVNGSSRGTITSSSSSGVFSDRDMKENIQDIEIGLSEVLNLKPRKFKYKSGTHETYGFIAQEVETVVPLAVDEIELPEADPEANKTTLKTLDTISIIAALVKSVQELSQTLTDRNQEVTDLENRIETIEQRLI